MYFSPPTWKPAAAWVSKVAWSVMPFDRLAISSGFRKEDEEAAHRAGVAP